MSGERSPGGDGKGMTQALPPFLHISVVSLVLALLLTSSSCSIWKEPRSPSWKSAAGAEQYELLMWKAIRAGDWKEVEAHMAPLFAGAGPAGEKLDRAAFIERWKAVKIRDLSMGEATVQPSGTDMVVTYELHLDASGLPAAPKGLRIVSVWQQLKRGWVLTAQSATPIL